MSTDFKATINQQSERASAWLEVFGSHEIPLCSPMPTRASAPGVPEGLFYHLDLKHLPKEQRSRLISFIAQKFHIPEKEVAESLDEVGCPILADDLTITIFHPQKWI